MKNNSIEYTNMRRINMRMRNIIFDKMSNVQNPKYSNKKKNNENRLNIL